MLTCTDQLGTVLQLPERPRRIVSLVPSQSELLWDLGLREALVGITKFCIHPDEMFRSVERVGGTKQLDIEKIRRLKPDLIIGNKEENERGQIGVLQNEFPVWMSDIYNFEDAFAMMRGLGEIFEKQARAFELVKSLEASLQGIKNIFNKERTAYFIWYKPYMLAAHNTFIHFVLNYIGLENAVKNLVRYPEVDAETLKKINPQVCLLSSEPFPFKEKHIRELQKILPEAKILVVDGEVFSWYGSRLLHLENYTRELKLRL